jgi:hypothetical protein
MHSHSGGLAMESSRAAAPALGSTGLTRALCMLILALMAAAAVYGSFIAFRYYSAIGV